MAVQAPAAVVCRHCGVPLRWSQLLDMWWHAGPWTGTPHAPEPHIDTRRNG